MFTEGTIQAIISLITTIFTAVMAYLMARLNGKVAEMQSLVNYSLETQLKLTAMNGQRLAEITKLPEDAKLAADSRTAVDEHIKSQQKGRWGNAK